MLGTAVIVFREVLEAALVVAIVLGASRGIARRGRWIVAGIATGLAGAATLAAFAGELATNLSGNGQTLVNIVVLLAAVAMLAWHNAWMSRHGRQMATQIAETGSAVGDGGKPVLALAIVVAAAVMREGAELVLFLWAILASGGDRFGMASGAMLGVGAGLSIGALLYRGLLRIPLRYFFAVTSWLVLLLAAGLAAQAAAALNQAGWLPALGTGLWDSSGILSQQSVAGQLLHILIGYTARPSGIQVLFYVVTLIGIFLLMQAVRLGERRHPAAGAQDAGG